MNAFIVELENRPGMLAGLAESIAAKGINITAIAAATSVDRGSVALLVSDPDGARSILAESGLTFREAAAVSAALEDRPGSLAEAARRLATAGVNVEALFATGMDEGKVTLALAVDDEARARDALGELAAG